MTKPTFTPGRNIALKVPSHLFEQTVRFYREILGLATIARYEPSIVIDFGGKNLWIDNVPHISHSELWLEVVTDDHEAAATYFAECGVTRCDPIEPLPDDHKGFWIMDTSNTVIHLAQQSAAV